RKGVRTILQLSWSAPGFPITKPPPRAPVPTTSSPSLTSPRNVHGRAAYRSLHRHPIRENRTCNILQVDSQTLAAQSCRVIAAGLAVSIAVDRTTLSVEHPRGGDR